MKLLTHIPAWLKNKYVVSVCIFAAIMFFFDKNDLFTQLARRQQLENLKASKQFYTNEITKERRELEKLRSNPATLEQYAREKYLMKKDNEDLFIIAEKPTEGK